MAKSPKDATRPAHLAATGPGPYRIHAAAALSGIPAATLRAWERRYRVPVPRRTTSAYRLYSAEDVALVRRMNDLVLGGMPPSDAARTVLVSDIDIDVEGVAPSAIPSDPLEHAQQRILAATQRWDADAIDAELARLSYLVDLQTLHTRVLSPVLVEVGERWHRGELSIAQERLLSEKVELSLRASLRTLDRRDGPLAMLACVEGETHVIGLLSAALRFAMSGWRVLVLGAATPASAVADAVRSLRPRLVALSVTLRPARARALFGAYAKAVGTIPWVVGGMAANDVERSIAAAGGAVAAAPGSAWNQQVRAWLRAGH